MQYLQPFLYFARKPKTGYKNVLFGCLCTLVPFAGEMVLLGYRAEVSHELERDPDLKDHPDFDLDRLMPYLMRGVWPYLSKLIALMILLAVGAVLALTAGLGFYQVVPEPILAFAVGYSLYFIFFILASTIVWPMEYHAQITRKFAPIDDLKFAIRFARVCWMSTFTAVLAHTFLSSVTLMLGMLLCWIGIYPAIVIVQMAEQHMMSQLYRLYLAEGGAPIERPEVIEERSRFDEELDDDDEPPQRARRVDPAE